MRFSSYINNQRCLEWGLNANQGALFDLLNQTASWANEVIIDGTVFYWVSRNEVIRELPLFYAKPDTVYRHFVELDKKELIEYRKVDGKDLIRLTIKGKTWNEFNSEINPNQLGLKSESTRIEIRKSSDLNPTNNNTNNKNTIDQNNPPSPPTVEPAPAEVVLNYLNAAVAVLAEQLGERRPVGFQLKPWAKNISARIAECSVADCLCVVDFLVAKWGRDEKMREYLCPKTIFRASNFAAYLPKALSWASNGRPICVNGKWVKPSEVAKRLMTPTVEEARELLKKVISLGGFGNPFKHLDFSQKRNVVLYHAVINTKNKRPLEREMLSVLAKEIGNAVENADRLNPPTFNSGAEK